MTFEACGLLPLLIERSVQPVGVGAGESVNHVEAAAPQVRIPLAVQA